MVREMLFAGEEVLMRVRCVSPFGALTGLMGTGNTFSFCFCCCWVWWVFVCVVWLVCCLFLGRFSVVGCVVLFPSAGLLFCFFTQKL